VLDDGRAGALFPAGDADALASCLAALLDDPMRRRLLTARARAAVAAFDWPLVASRVVEVYASAIAAFPEERPAVSTGDHRPFADRLPPEWRRRLRAGPR
jgi:phosphatidylinositol alpha-mannosyltransferase